MKTKPTIAMIPSAYKDGKLFSVLPSDGSGDFDVTRSTSATRVNKDGIIEVMGINIPRLDYSEGGCPKLLLENASTNLISDSANWNYGGAPPTSEEFINAPDGSNNAVIPTVADLASRFEEIIPPNTYNAGDKLTISWYRKRIETPTGFSVLGDLKVKSLANFNVFKNNSQISSNINGFDRFSATVEVVDGSQESKLRLYYGDVVEVGNASVAYWGFQLEEAEFASSYIPTDGATATRGVDDLILDGINSLIGSNNSFFVEGRSDGDNGGGTISFFDVENNLLGRFYLGRSEITTQVRVDNPPLNIIRNTVKRFQKLAVKNTASVYEVFINGEMIGEIPNQVNFGIDKIEMSSTSLISGGQTFVSRLEVYNKALSDEELINLTK